MSDQEFEKETAARALNALTHEQAAEFDAQASPAELQEVADFEQVAAELAKPVAQTPPPGLRESVLSQIATTAQVGAGDSAAENAPKDARLRGPAVFALAASAAIALVVGGFAVGSLYKEPTPEQNIVSAPDVRTDSVVLADGSRATVLFSLERAEAALIFEPLTPLEEDKTYQAWVIRDGQATSAGTFSGSENSLVYVLDGSLSEQDVIGVTVEPAGGSQQPTSEPILMIALTS